MLRTLLLTNAMIGNLNQPDGPIVPVSPQLPKNALDPAAFVPTRYATSSRLGDLDDTMTVQEAADILGVNRTRIYAMMNDGRLGSQKVGGARLVNARDVMDTFNARQADAPKAGRPKKAALA